MEGEEGLDKTTGSKSDSNRIALLKPSRHIRSPCELCHLVNSHGAFLKKKKFYDFPTLPETHPEAMCCMLRFKWMAFKLKACYWVSLTLCITSSLGYLVLLLNEILHISPRCVIPWAELRKPPHMIEVLILLLAYGPWHAKTHTQTFSPTLWAYSPLGVCEWVLSLLTMEQQESLYGPTLKLYN